MSGDLIQRLDRKAADRNPRTSFRAGSNNLQNALIVLVKAMARDAARSAAAAPEQQGNDGTDHRLE